MIEGEHLFKYCIELIVGIFVYLTAVLILMIIKSLTSEDTSKKLRMHIMIRYLLYFLMIVFPTREAFHSILYNERKPV